MNTDIKYIPLPLAGRCSNGYERGKGNLVHMVREGKGEALCGAEPGHRSVGWSSTPRQQATCPKCLKRHEALINARFRFQIWNGDYFVGEDHRPHIMCAMLKKYITARAYNRDDVAVVRVAKNRVETCTRSAMIAAFGDQTNTLRFHFLTVAHVD